MQDRFENFTSEEQIILAMGLCAVWDDLQRHMEMQPLSPEMASWEHSQKKAEALQDELGALWAEKTRSA